MKNAKPAKTPLSRDERIQIGVAIFGLLGLFGILALAWWWR